MEYEFVETALGANPGRISKGRLLLRTLAMPSDTNANGDIFGGWIMSQMDIGGAIMAKEIAQGKVVTVSVDKINFIRPVSVGDVICCYGRCVKVGNSSIKIKVEVWVKKVSTEPFNERYCVTDAIFTFVAIDQNGRPKAISKVNNPELDNAILELESYQSDQAN